MIMKLKNISFYLSVDPIYSKNVFTMQTTLSKMISKVLQKIVAVKKNEINIEFSQTVLKIFLKVCETK